MVTDRGLQSDQTRWSDFLQCNRPLARPVTVRHSTAASGPGETWLGWAGETWPGWAGQPFYFELDLTLRWFVGSLCVIESVTAHRALKG